MEDWALGPGDRGCRDRPRRVGRLHHEIWSAGAGCFRVAAMPFPNSVMDPSVVFPNTNWPSLKRISDRMPVAGARTSTVTLSDSTSTSGSAMVTGSPTRLNHRPIEEFVADIPVGTGILVSMSIVRSLEPLGAYMGKRRYLNLPEGIWFPIHTHRAAGWRRHDSRHALSSFRVYSRGLLAVN